LGTVAEQPADRSGTFIDQLVEFCPASDLVVGPVDCGLFIVPGDAGLEFGVHAGLWVAASRRIRVRPVVFPRSFWRGKRGKKMIYSSRDYGEHGRAFPTDASTSA
jgi:hypothetical protein